MQLTAIVTGLSMAFVVLGIQEPTLVSLVERPVVSGPPPPPEPAAPPGACGQAVNLPNMKGWEWLIGDGKCNNIGVGFDWVVFEGRLHNNYQNCKRCRFWTGNDCNGRYGEASGIKDDSLWNWSPAYMAHTYKCET